MNFGTLWRMFGPRIVGTLVSAIAGFIFAKSKGAVQINPEQVTEIATVMIGSYAAAHSVTAIKLNPAQAASPALVKEGVVANDVAKANEAASEANKI